MREPIWKLDQAERSPARVNPVAVHRAERRTGLDGEWLFRLDPDDVGAKRKWFNSPGKLTSTVRVPGCWQGQGHGHDGPSRVWDFGLEDRTLRATYEGTGWYGRTFRVPDALLGARVWLNFGGVHPSADVYLNGRKLGSHSGPFVPFAFDVTDAVDPDAENFLAVRVHEALRWLGLSYNWQAHWSGLYRGVELSATGAAWLTGVRILPDLSGKCLRICGEVQGDPGRAELHVAARPAGGARKCARSFRIEGGGAFEVDLPVPSPKPWSPDAPHLYEVDVALCVGDATLDALTERAGFVEFEMRGKQFCINGEPYFMRGTGDFNCCPETGSPDTDRDRWRRKLQTLRDYGYNYVRCQSYVPAPEYFDAADEVGLIVQSEMGALGAWGGNTVWHLYAWPPPRAPYADALQWQWDAVVVRDASHPSAAIYCMSNELGHASTPYPKVAWDCCRRTRRLKPGALVLWTDGGWRSELPQDFANDEAGRDAECPLPLIQHEFRWWSAHPDVRIKSKYKGAARPYAIERAQREAAEWGLKGLLPTFAANSQRVQLIESKGKMEVCRRDHPALAGICHFNAMDIGYSPQGVVDEFCEPKLADAATWRRANGDTVVLAGLPFDARVPAGGGELRCALTVSDFSHPPLARPTVEWKVQCGRRTVAEGAHAYRHRPFCACPAGVVRTELPQVSKPTAARLNVTVREGRRRIENAWDLWVMPAEVAMPDGVGVYGARKHTWLRKLRGLPRVRAGDTPAPDTRVVLTEAVDGSLAAWIKAGGRAVLAAGEGLVRPFSPNLGLAQGRYFFTPPAHYPPYNAGHEGTVVADSPLLGDMPHEGFCDLQFYRLMADTPPFDLDALGVGRSTPVIRAISNAYRCRPLAYLAEYRLGKGGLVVSALDLDPKLPEARCVLASILRHASGRAFAPEVKLPRRGLELLTALAGL